MALEDVKKMYENVLVITLEKYVLSRFKPTLSTLLIIMEHMCHRYVPLCLSHNHIILSSLVTCHHIFNRSNNGCH